MKWKDGDLDGECKEKCKEDPILFFDCQMRGIQVYDLEGMRCRCPEIEVYQGHQHKQTPRKGVNKEFEGDADAVVAAPYGTDKISRNQRQFPKDVKHKAIISAEDTDKSHFHQQD